MKRITTTKKKTNFKYTSLNIRNGSDERCCRNCQHVKIPDNIKHDPGCHVMNKPVKYAKVCDGWNSAAIENTWYLLVGASKDTMYFGVKEIEGEAVRDIGSKEIKLPVKSTDEEIEKFFQEKTKEKGCPDYVVNITTDRFKPESFKGWLDYRCIKYREMTVDCEVDLSPGEIMTPLEKLSMFLEAFLETQVEPKQKKETGH
jgi:hypothetical protein